MTNERACATGEGFPITHTPKTFTYPMALDAGEVDEQVFRIEALAEALETLIWHNNALNEAGRDSGAGAMIELVTIIRRELKVLGSRVST